MFQLTYALLLLAGSVLAQGTVTRSKPAEYPVQADAGDVELGAEFMVRLISWEQSSFVTDNYLIVEVAMFPKGNRAFNITGNRFSLRLNGRKELLLPQTPGTVAASIRYPDWENPQSVAVAQRGDAGVILGGPSAGRFPGDNRAPRAPFPPVPRAPQEETEIRKQSVSPEEVLNRSALPEGERKTSVSGYLFFPWRGNPSKIKSAELLVRQDSGNPVSLRLR